MRQLLFIVSLLLSLTTVGAIGFRITEGWDWLQCVYEAVIILTTVGLSATSQSELANATKAFIIAYLMLGVGVGSYAVTQLGQHIVTLQVRGILERRSMERALNRLHDHFIICGLGRMGREICQYLASRRQPFVVVDVNGERLEATCREHNWLYLSGDATRDEVLLQAGIARAKSLASVLPTDADNVYVVLSARLLNDRLQIIARASDDKAGEKLQRAGATRVVSPYSSGAQKMARFLLNPSVEDFLAVTDDHGSELQLAEVLLRENCSLVGKQLNQTDLRDHGVMVLSIRRATGERLMPPGGSAVLQAGDLLFVFGGAQAVSKMISLSDPAT